MGERATFAQNFQPMRSNQKYKFDLDPNVHYMNGAAYSPLPAQSMEAGKAAIHCKGQTPFEISMDTFFGLPDRLRAEFAQLIGSDAPNRVALIPAASYGLATVANNLHRIQDKNKTEILILGEDFPNNIYTFQRAAARLGWTVKSIPAPAVPFEELGAAWNTAFLEAISEKTACVVATLVHWTKGVLFDMEALGQACTEVNALFVVDGSQGIGIVPFDVEKCKVDALVTAAYKWLMGPYGSGLAYFGPFFDEGIPIEESWMNRKDSDIFPKLTDYQDEYRPEAQRYNQGEFSNFIGTPILHSSLKLINELGVKEMYAYCEKLTAQPIEALKTLGCTFLAAEYRVPHLMSIGLPSSIHAEKLAEALKEERIYVSLRGGGVRVSTHIYNTEADWAKLVEVIRRYV